MPASTQSLLNIIAWCMLSGGLAVGDARRALCTEKGEVEVVQRGLGMSKSDDGGRKVEDARLTYHKDDG